ncbi:unnamed protein product [Lepeophtheirus salmonis]|uniref:(salmon louse) hypothetical protein n=1 Tax=Lepeophtheirus salmonis TaxID=72036 RepID=A0A7R8GYS3_LEPSM|nr:unnamed protein product [Lepeophtheirus salmonis]CAF2752019.1 unnamed protein product [Lepeophtheirus salmonis]
MTFIEDEEEKEFVTKQVTGDILDIIIGEENCSEFEFTFDTPYEIHVDFVISHLLDQFKKWDLNFQGLSYLSGFIGHKMKFLYPDLGKKTNYIYLNDHGLIPWIYHLSKGGLMVSSD